MTGIFHTKNYLKGEKVQSGILKAVMDLKKIFGKTGHSVPCIVAGVSPHFPSF